MNDMPWIYTKSKTMHLDFFDYNKLLH